jgi:hypothetical protein
VHDNGWHGYAIAIDDEQGCVGADGNPSVPYMRQVNVLIAHNFIGNSHGFMLFRYAILALLSKWIVTHVH